MRPLRDIIRELRSKPLWYWLGGNEPFTYEVNEGRVFRASAGGCVEVVVFSKVEHWKKAGKRIVVYELDSTRIIMDPRNRLGSVLERQIPVKWVVEEDE